MIEQNNAKLLNALDIGIILIDASFHVVYLNQWIEVRLKNTSEINDNTLLFDLFPELCEETVRRKVKTTLTLNTPTYFHNMRNGYLFKIPLKKVSNRIFNYTQQSITLFPYNLETQTSAFIIYDQTAIAEANYKLEHQLNAIKALNEEISYQQETMDTFIPSITLTKEGEVLNVSSAFTDITAISLEMLLSCRCEFLKSLHSIVTNAIKTNVSTHGEVEIKNKNERAFWFDLTCAPENSTTHGKVYKIIMQDITDRKKVELLAITDYLTGANNRQSFENTLIHEIEISKRYDTTLSLILFDIDHFKHINDTYGHDIGDNVLIELVGVVKKNIRLSDMMARWGGEEFAVLLPRTGITEAKIVAEKIRLAIANHHFGNPPHVTASFGVVEFGHQDSKKSIVKRADEGLYKAKENGRNRVVVIEIMSN